MNGSPVTLRFHVGRIDDSTGSPIVHRINDVDVDPAVVADVQTFVRWTWRELREQERRADRLTRLLAEALSSWEDLARALCAEHCDPDGEGHDGDKCGADLDAIARIRREAGLT